MEQDKKIELREFLNPVEARAADGKKKIGGLAVPYNKDSAVMGDFVERFAKGAFTESLKTRDVQYLYAHNSEQIIARTSAGNLRLTDTDEGLSFEADLPNTQRANDLYEDIAVKNITKNSFGFFPISTQWDKDEARGLWIRTILQAELYEISAVSNPAYLDTSLAHRSLNNFQKSAGMPVEVARRAIEIIKIKGSI